MDKYILGKQKNAWHPSEAMQVTFIVTKECNLRCKYCYMTGKNNEGRMSFEIAKDAIDYFIKNKKELFNKEYIILDFIGGEPLLEIDLIDKVVDYFKYVTFINNDSWFGRYRINIATNGILYSSKKVQKFIEKNKNNLSIGISIDGTKEKHDMQRVYPDGRGSYDDVIENVKLWIKQYPEASTKVTIGHDDLPYVKDSIIHLWNLGIKNVPANTIFEDIWQDGDDIVYEQQLKELADYIIDNKKWNDVNTTLFSELVGFKQVEDEINKNFCGTGKSYAIDSVGNIYPCVRYVQYSLNNKKEICFGNIYSGVDKEKVRPFRILTTKLQSLEQCIECPISVGCSYCQAENYDSSIRNTNFERSLASCNMHKARVRANNYYWAKLYNLFNVDRFEEMKYKRSFDKILYVMLGSDVTNICANYNSNHKEIESITSDNFINALNYAEKNFMQPFVIHKNNVVDEEYIYSSEVKKLMDNHYIKHIVKYSKSNIEELKKYNKAKDIYPVFDVETVEYVQNDQIKNCILIIKKDELEKIAYCIDVLKKYYRRINLKCEVENEKDLNKYKLELEKVSNIIYESYKLNENIEVSVLTDNLFINDMDDNCKCGQKNLVYAPDGNVYLCPASYYDSDKVKPIGSEEIEMTNIKKAPTCKICTCYQCERCVYLNKKKTGEFNIPSSIQCLKSSIELKQTITLKNRLEAEFGRVGFNEIEEPLYEEPYQFLLNKWNLIK